ncbi:MAG: PP2C family protein-serine/threonine phosphatase [Pseudomonadota bacterium]
MSKVAPVSGVVERALLAGQGGDDAGRLEAALRARGIDVRRTRTATDSIAAMPGYEPDIVIVHWQRLDVLGSKFLRMLRDARLATKPFIVANGAPMDLTYSERMEALHDGADAVLSGQPKSQEIHAYVAMAARQKERAEASQEKMRRVMTKLAEVQSRFDSIDSDLMEARKLQQSLMRDRNVESGFAQISLVLRSCGHVGGDLVGHFPINEHLKGFFALDVSGHGVSSALMTARLAGYLSASHLRQNIAVQGSKDGWLPRSPAAAVTDLNQLVMEDLETDHYFTILLGHVDTKTGCVTFCQAGHPHPVHASAAGRIEFIGAGGLPVGLIPGADYEDTQIAMGAGDRLYLLSDGFTEAELPNGELVGDQGLIRLLNASKGLAAPAVLEALIWDLNKTIGEAEFQDDLSGVLIEFSGSPKV